jgi:hypothetical protein
VPPVFVNCRDRVASLRELVSWLERAGCDEIYLIDNASTYEPLLEYYRSTSHTVVRLDENYGKFSFWQAPGVRERAGDRPFVYTDPDVVPVPECPLDALDRFAALLDRYPAVTKVGFGLRIDDIPEYYRHRNAVIAWERQMWEWPVERGAYYAPIDTTFALYRGGASSAREAIRTGWPYVARHDSWYLDLDTPDEEERYYAAHAATNTEHATGHAHWVGEELPESFRDMLDRIGARRTSRIARVDAKLRWHLRGKRTLRRVTR